MISCEEPLPPKSVPRNLQSGMDTTFDITMDSKVNFCESGKRFVSFRQRNAIRLLCVWKNHRNDSRTRRALWMSIQNVRYRASKTHPSITRHSRKVDSFFRSFYDLMGFSQMERILALSKDRNFTLACTATWEAQHGLDCPMTIEKPLDYYKLSMEAKAFKKDRV